MIFIAGGIKHSQAYHADPILPWPSAMRSRAGVLSRAISIMGRSRSTTRQRNVLCGPGPQELSLRRFGCWLRTRGCDLYAAGHNQLNGLDAELYLRRVY